MNLLLAIALYPYYLFKINLKNYRLKCIKIFLQNLNDEKLFKLSAIVKEYTGQQCSKFQQIAESNKDRKPERLIENCAWTWTNTSHKPTFLISDDVNV